MPANSRWPDFRLASALRSLVGSQSDHPDKLEAASPASPANDLHPTSNQLSTVPTAENEARREAKVAEQPAIMDADLPNQAIDGLEAFDEYDNESGDDGGMDADFGALEMFDSNAVAAPFSTQPQQIYGENSGQAPAAVMSADPPASPPKTRKSKRDKKSKKKDAYADAPREEGRHRRAKHASALETSEAADALTTLASAAEPYAQRSDQVEESPDSPAHQKRKRKPSDAASAKKRSKKRRAGGDSVDPETGEASATGGFLHKHEGADVTAIADEDVDADGSDPQGSPTIGHLRRQSHSEEHFATPDGLMQDVTNEQAQVIAGGDAIGELAREAWQEHLQTQENARNEDAEMADADEDLTAEHTYATPPEHEVQADPSPSGARPKRSKAKKAKPTFYENPPDEPEDDDDAYADLPSPSAMTPKRRSRVKPAARKGGARRRNASPGDDDGDHGRSVKRNKTDGYVQGRFTDNELQLITRAVEAFRDENNLSQREVNEVCTETRASPLTLYGGLTVLPDDSCPWWNCRRRCTCSAVDSPVCRVS